MRVWSDIDALPGFRSPVVTVGSFDGVHRGHLHLLEALRQRALEIGGESIVVTFDRHPRQVLHADEQILLLTSSDEKARLIDLAGVDNLVVMPFDPQVAAMPPQEFIRDFLVGRLGAKELVVGYNHRFGHGRTGDAKMLRGLEKEYGFRVFEASRFGGNDDDGAEKISSTTIRNAISRGDVEAAERMLGRKILQK
jgi:riboflavin kinase/FMN adenylyltransferase